MEQLIELKPPKFDEDKKTENQTSTIMDFLGNQLNVIETSFYAIKTFQERHSSGMCLEEIANEKITKYQKRISEHVENIVSQIDKYLRDGFQKTKIIDQKKLEELRSMLDIVDTEEKFNKIKKYYFDNFIYPHQIYDTKK